METQGEHAPARRDRAVAGAAGPRLPTPLTSFVGRQRDLTHARRFVGQHRLVTLVGPGGIGKSRIARELGATAPPETVTDGVWMVELHGVAPGADVAEAVTVGLGLGAGRGTPLETLEAFVAGRTMVLALDGCEHLLTGIRDLVVTLLRLAPGLRVLATSQQPLGVFGEQVVPVGPLGLPSELHPVTLAEARRTEAVQLLEARAVAVDPGFALDAGNVADAVTVCRRLDGLPLALELAAARLRTIGLRELVSRLDDRFALLSRGDPTGVAHHQTLRAMVGWSHDLCTPAEQRLWADLSVLAGGADLASISQVCRGDGSTRPELLDDLEGLVSKSIVQADTSRGTPRYRMLETLREYGAERLAETGRAEELQERHATYFAGLADDFASGFFSADQVVWIERVRLERLNLTAALRHLLASPEGAEVGLRMATDLRMHWISGAACEGRRWLRQALAANPAPTLERSLGLGALAVLSALSVEQSDSLLTEADRISAGLGSTLARARYEDARAAVLTMHGGLVEAYAAGRRAVELAAAAGDPGAQLTGYSSATIAAVLLGQEDARRTCWEMAAACEAVGDRWLQAWAHHHLAVSALQRGDLAEAAACVDRCLELAHESSNLVVMAMVLVPAARLALHGGRYQRAAQLIGGAFELAAAIGAGAEPLGTLAASIDVVRTQSMAALGEVRYHRAYRQGAAWPRDQLVAAATAGWSPGQHDEDAAGLSAREWDVVRLVALGKTNRAIAADLHLSPRTVEGHVERILAKRGFRRRTEIATWATQHLDDVSRSSS